MNKRKTAFLLALCMAVSGCLLGAGSAFAYGAGQEEPQFSGEYAEDELLVVFESDVTEKAAEKVVERQDGENMTLIDTPQEDIIGLVELPEGQTVEAAAARYEAEPDVAYVQPNYSYQLADDAGSGLAEKSAVSLNDARSKDLWHLDMIQAQEAWELMQDIPHEKVRVAILDTGASLTHEDLQANINKSLCVDLSNNGRPRIFRGDDDGHGTHVTGILAATANNGLGVAGVAAGADNSCVEAFVVDVFTSNARGETGASTAAMVAAIQYAVDKKAKVINMSLGYEEGEGSVYEDRLLENAINKATAAGITIAAASGNGSEVPKGVGNTKTNYPADFDNCISVISVGPGKKRSQFSNYGAAKDISAPGEAILSAGRESGYVLNSGTSMATPIVSGVAALLYSIDPDMTPAQIKQILYSSAEDIYTAGRDDQSGYGIVNAYRAVAMTQRPVTRLSLNSSSLSLLPGRSARLQAEMGGTGSKDVVWTSSNPSVATVDGEGNVTAKDYGTAVITAKAADAQEFSASCKVTVPYTVTYNLNGGKNSVSNPSSYYGKTVTLKAPVRAGYVFAGWYSDSVFTSKVASFSSGSQTLYAKWTRVTVSGEAVKGIKQLSRTKAAVTCRKISGVKYQFLCSTTSRFTKSATKYKTSASASVNLTGLKKGKLYYVKVRAWKLDSAGQVVYGTYSSVKKFKLK